MRPPPRNKIPTAIPLSGTALNLDGARTGWIDSRMRVAILIAAALTTGTAVAQQMPSDSGNAANGPIAIFKNNTPEPGGFVIRINGHDIDHGQMAAYDDITGVVHAGSNNLTVTWSGPLQLLDFKIAYAPTRNNFRNLLVFKADANQDPALRQSGSQNFVFTIPN